LTTETIKLYTTVCPVEQAGATSTLATSAGVVTSVPASTTSIVYGTTTYFTLGQLTTETVKLYTTVCPVEQAASSGAAAPICSTCTTSTQYQTSTATKFNTIPYVTPTGAAIPVSPANVTIPSSSTIVKIVTQTMVPVAASNSTTSVSIASFPPVAVGTGGLKVSTSAKVAATSAGVLTSTTAGVAVQPTASPSVYTGGATGLQSGSVLALVMAGVVAMFL